MHHVRTAYKTQTDTVCGKAFQVFFWEAVYMSNEGVATDPDKTLVMEQWPIPKKSTELRGFLILTSYYRKFVNHYGLISKPLAQLLTKKGLEWHEQAIHAFLALKEAMQLTVVLALP